MLPAAITVMILLAVLVAGIAWVVTEFNALKRDLEDEIDTRKDLTRRVNELEKARR